MPGWGRRAAQDAVAETGADMTRFRTGRHLVAWGSRAPMDHQSGTRKGQARSKKGNRYLGAVLGPGLVRPKRSSCPASRAPQATANRTREDLPPLNALVLALTVRGESFLADVSRSISRRSDHAKTGGLPMLG